MKINHNIQCPVEATLNLIGGKYKPIILWHLINKTLRFGELSRLIPTATPKMLTQQLRELEKDGLIIRVVYPVVPPKVEYTLSDFGKSILPVLESMCSWGTDYLQGSFSDITICPNQITDHLACAGSKEL